MRKTIASVLLLTGALACSKPEPPPPPPTTRPAPPTTTLPPVVSISTVTLGKAVGADKKVTTPADTFGAKDTIYASVDTAGSGHAKIRALWTFVKGAKTAKVDETTIEIDATGPATNEFHVSKPSGWPKGDYKVEIFLNDGAAAAATKDFKVG